MTTTYQDISAIDLRDFLKSFGWQPRDHASTSGLVVLAHPDFPRRQLVFPVDSSAPDYADAIGLTLQKVADLQSLPIESVLTQLSELNDDTVRFRVVDTRHTDNFIPLSYAVTALKGAKDLLLSAASTVLQPQVRHPSKPRTQAQEFVDQLRFRQTERGSFILKVSAPIRAVDFQADLFGNERSPFVRKATLTACRSLNRLVTAIETDQIDQLVTETRQSPTPELSTNLCNAVTYFRESHDDYDLYVDFAWAASVSPPPGIRSEIKVQKDYFSRIYDVAQALRKDTPESEEESFLATVEHLAGDIGSDGRRYGEVILNLYPRDEEPIRARAMLTADQYEQADKAHMKAGAYIKVTGILQPGYQPRNLTIRHFELLPD